MLDNKLSPDGKPALSTNTTKHGNVGRRLTYLDLIKGQFFVEVFSGSGRLSAALRLKGLQVFEFDLTEQGGRRNLLHANVLHELKALIAHPLCKGVWFGYPYGTFSSARRDDGGPPPLRGTNPKDIWVYHTSSAKSAHASTPRTTCCYA